MAPIQASDDDITSTYDEEFGNRRESSKRSRNILLPICQKGSFFHDAFFSDVRHELDAAVRQALERWADEDLKLKDLWHENHCLGDVLRRYRRLRSRNLKDDIQALKIKSDHTSRKVVMDVHDFMEGDIKVKVEGETELLVEGSVEKKDEGNSSVSSHAFRRRFSLPRLTDTRDISSAMSSDGVLTITMPTENLSDSTRTRIIPVDIEGTSEDETVESSSTSENLALKVSSQMESEEGKCSDLSSTTSWELPISRRGSFFQDHIFSDFHKEFEAAVKEILSRWRDIEVKWADRRSKVDSHVSDILEHYRQLRTLNLQEKDHHAVNVASDNTRHKIVLDMQDFVDGDVSVKVLGEKDLLVEGRVEKREGKSSMAARSIKRRFALPLLSDPSSVTSVMSSDGILTISSPKKDTNKVENSTLIPINLEPSQCKLSTMGKDFNNTEVKSTCVDGKLKDSHEHVLLPLSRRGLFFRDSFFEDARNDFREAVKEILSKWGGESSIVDDLASYRRLRSLDLSEDTQAVTSSEDERQHKFVLDVHDFTDGGEISVKALNDRELVVEGHSENAEGGSETSRKLLRRFVLPNDIQLEAVTSAISSDGVLKISAPKKEVLMKNKRIPIELEDQHQLQAAPINKDNNAVSCDPSSNAHEEQSEEKDLMGPPPTDDDEDDDDQDDNDDEGITLIIRQPESLQEVAFGNEDDHSEDLQAGEKEKFRSCIKNHSEVVPSSVTSPNRLLPVEKKGPFQDDHFFRNIRDSYEQAVREVLEKANEWSCRSEAANNYRSLRQRRPELGNQAVRVSEDHLSHTVTVDVSDFVGGEVTVRLEEGKELVVEGRAERQDGGRVSRLSFVRRFSLPPLVDLDTIVCAVSSDGILAIVSKKRAE